MNPDELRERLRRIDPVPETTAMEPPTTSASRTRLENVMRTEIPTEPTEPGGPDHRPAVADPGRRRTAWIAAAAALVLVAGVAVAVIGGDDDTGDVASGPALELDLGASDAMASCMPVEARFLADMPVAFAGTAESVDGELVTLEVDRWYAGGDADRVVLRSPAGMEALIEGVTFEPGARYLVSATEGTVNFCGYSGPATPELTALYEEAFGA